MRKKRWITSATTMATYEKKAMHVLAIDEAKG